MLYAESMMSSKLAEALRGLGVPEDLVKEGMDFIDLSEEADYSKLDDIKPFKLGRSVDWNKHEKVIKAFKTEILRENNEELTCRYLNWAFAATGIDCIWIVNEDHYSTSPEYQKRLEKALTKRFGSEKAKAAAFAVEFSRFANVSLRYSYRKMPTAAPAVCIGAAEFLGSSPDYVTLMGLCICALDQCDPDSPDAVSDKAVEIVLDASAAESRMSQNEHEYRQVALCEAARFSEKAEKEFFARAKNGKRLAEIASWHLTDLNRICSLVEQKADLLDKEYIYFIAKKGKIKRLSILAKEHKELYKQAIAAADPLLAVELENVLAETDKTYDRSELDLKKKLQDKITVAICKNTKTPKYIFEFLEGRCGFEEMFPDGSKLNMSGRGSGNANYYYNAYGNDVFFERLITLLMICDCGYGRSYTIRTISGFSLDCKNVSVIFDAMSKVGAPLGIIINYLALYIDDMYSDKEKVINAAVECAAKQPDALAEIDPKTLCATARVILTKSFGTQPHRFSKEIMLMTDDTSKAVKAELLTILSKTATAENISELLKAKKQAKRELAVSIIEKKGADSFKDELSAAFESEKSDKLKIRIGSLLGMSEAVEEQKETDKTDIIKKLTKSTAKLTWLKGFTYPQVKKKDGSDADEQTLNALLMCYAPMTSASRNTTADFIAEQLDTSDLEKFAGQVFSQWCALGAQAKQKWVLYFSAVHGGREMTAVILRSIKEWAENMRGAIAAEAVRALALGGSSKALMALDSMSRKFKNKQVRNAAAESLANAAEQLGITTEELADRIVPDLGFDDNLCRVFDYGSRQFNVYLRPSLELEIMNGEKTIKTLPKPGAKDDAEKASAAYEEFKEMKKLIKNAVTAQRARLEYVMLCDRRWTSESWRTLFVKNALMHCFAIGLIWGVYEDSKLTVTFRYMEDGSFTTSDGDEFELPENASIGLVHPLDITEELKNEWIEQLSDFEITQPFPQLSRKCYRPTDDELKQKRITRFDGCEFNSLSLINKMIKLGWDKGVAEDAGWFSYFVRKDLTSRKRREDGTVEIAGNAAMLTFSGASIVNYDFEGEEVEIYKLGFCKPDVIPYHYEKDESYIDISTVPPRYFSEIIMQLTSVFGEKEDK